MVLFITTIVSPSGEHLLQRCRIVRCRIACAMYSVMSSGGCEYGSICCGCKAG